MAQSRVYLSRRNLLTLLSKLDRQRDGEPTACTLVKNDNVHPKYPQTMASIEITAVEDDEYYRSRHPGMVHPSDRPDDRPEHFDIFKEPRLRQ
jgi:hypothetical protein